MRLATVRHLRGSLAGREEAAVVTPAGPVPVAAVQARLGRPGPTGLLELIEAGLDPALAGAAAGLPALAPDEFTFAPLYRRPRKLWGIGLNYRDHAADLAAPLPAEPASFMKGDHTIVGPGDPIVLPPESGRVTAEGELGLVIGRTCRKVSEAEALSCLAGVCLVIDVTAEDILARNPRFLTRAKNFDTFFSFGPELVSLDELSPLEALRVETLRNGAVHRSNVVANMTFSPAHLIAFHSRVMTLYPGDLISSGTPGAVVIEDGDVAECRIEGLGSLRNPVVRPA